MSTIPGYVDRDSTAIGERLTVAELAALYAKCEADIRRSFGQVADSLRTLTLAFLGSSTGHDISLHRSHGRYLRLDFSDPEETITELRRDIWGYLIERAAFRKAMSVRAWKELSEKIEKETPPPITAETIQGMIDQFQADMPAMLKEAVAEVFEFLRPPGSEYKTNSEFEIGERVVLSNYIGQGYGRTWDTEHWHDQQLIALENVFAMVDGKVAERSGHYSNVALEIKRIPLDEKCHGATPLFEFRGFRNGNLHLKFRRMDLVRKLNAVAGGARLKPPRTP